MVLAHDYFQENLALLQEHHPLVWQAVLDYAGEPLGELQPAEDGNPNLLVRKEDGEEIFLHEPKAPLSELAEYYNLVPENVTGVVVFVGMGLGYAPPAMLASRNQLRHLLILEPETGLFIQALHALDLSSLLTDYRVTIATGQDINVPALLASMSRALQLESLYILQHNPCFRIAPEIYTSMHDEIYKHGNAYNVGGNTTSAYGDKFIDNRLRHLSAIHHQQLLEHLKDAFVGIPAIIVAGGPSLNKNIHLLSQAKGRAVIIAADTVLPALLAHGVTPDFTSCIDMQDITLEKIIDVAVDAGETSLVCSSWLAPTVAKNFPARQVYWSFTAKNMETWLNNLLDGKVLTTGAGTVAQLNFIAAYLLGCSPIIFVGQDLAFVEQESHAKHTSLTSKDELKGLLAREEILWVDGYGGGKVPTYRAYLGFKHHFEQAMAGIKDRQFINATEGGVRLEGTEELPLQEVLSRHCRREMDVAAMIREAEDHARMPGRRQMIDEFARMTKAIAGVEKDMASLDVLAAKLSKEISKLQEQGTSYQKFETLPVALQRQLLEVDALNAKLDKAKVWALLDEVTMEGLRQSERLNHEIKQLADQSEQYLEWLGRAINRFVVISQFRRQVLAPFAQRLKHLHSHLQREDFLLKKLAKQKGDDRETVLELLRLYFENGDHVLLEKTIAAHCPEPAQSAELSLYLGVIAAHRCQFAVMERYFARIEDIDPSWTERIAECRERLATQYLGFYHEWQRNDQVVALRMLFKAARYTTDHQALRQTLAAEVALVMAKDETVAGQETTSVDLADILAAWSMELTANLNLGKILGPEQVAILHRLHGSALLTQEAFSEAAQAFTLALALTPKNPQLCLLLADAAFAMDDYPAGLSALDRAVALDRSYAKYWEDIGDTLLTAGQPADAALAYEKCFQALPEEVGLLRKIADCYLAVGSS
ncbi:MAG: DUF115 domain-containing protein [Deltaproteobacteria bacterium]|nr:DUF115 domain-containing protein [Deltaproteobacteria bacterium]